MESQFVTYVIAKLLKDLGFNERCFKYYNKTPFTKMEFCLHGKDEYLQFHKNNQKVIAPLWQQAISWLKTKGILVTELWDGWEVAKNGHEFVYYPTKETAILKAIELLDNATPNLSKRCSCYDEDCLAVIDHLLCYEGTPAVNGVADGYCPFVHNKKLIT